MQLCSKLAASSSHLLNPKLCAMFYACACRSILFPTLNQGDYYPILLTFWMYHNENLLFQKYVHCSWCISMSVEPPLVCERHGSDILCMVIVLRICKLQERFQSLFGQWITGSLFTVWLPFDIFLCLTQMCLVDFRSWISSCNRFSKKNARQHEVNATC